MKATNPDKLIGPPKWPYRAAAIVGVIWVVGIIVMIAAGDTLFAGLTLEQTETFSRNFTVILLGLATVLVFCGFIIRRAHDAKK